MGKNKKITYKNFWKKFEYDFNIYKESELLNFYLKQNFPKDKIIYNEEPEYLLVENVNLNILKEFNKYTYGKTINYNKCKTVELEPVNIKHPPLLEDYYKSKNIIFKKKKDVDEIPKNIKLYCYLEKKNIINVRLDNLDEDNFNVLK